MLICVKAGGVAPGLTQQVLPPALIQINTTLFGVLNLSVHRGGQVDQSKDQLLAQCEAARGDGRDFPTIWLTILAKHPLVVGLPRHDIMDGEAVIVVRLIDGQTLLCSTHRFWLA